MKRPHCHLLFANSKQKPEEGGKRASADADRKADAIKLSIVNGPIWRP